MATQAQLDEARKALHALLTGKGIASIHKDGRSVTYTPATEGKLRAYIADLERKLGINSNRRGPVGFGL